MAPILIEAFRRLVEIKDQKNSHGARELTKIWQERNVLPKPQIKEMIQILDEATSSSRNKISESAEKAMDSNLPEGLIKVPHELV